MGKRALLASCERTHKQPFERKCLESWVEFASEEASVSSLSSADRHLSRNRPPSKDSGEGNSAGISSFGTPISISLNLVLQERPQVAQWHPPRFLLPGIAMAPAIRCSTRCGHTRWYYRFRRARPNVAKLLLSRPRPIGNSMESHLPRKLETQMTKAAKSLHPNKVHHTQACRLRRERCKS